MWESGDKRRGDMMIGENAWGAEGEATTPKDRRVTPSKVGNNQQEDINKVCD